MKNWKLKIPRGVPQYKHMIDFPVYERVCIYIPDQAIENKGIYVSLQDLVKLLRANKNCPEAIQYLADMME